MKRGALRALSWVCFALSLAAIVAIIPAAQYINEPESYTTGRLADLFVLAAFLLPLGGAFAFLGVFFFRRSCRDTCQL